MKPKRFTLSLAFILAAAFLFLAGCTSMTVIESIPAGAKVYINDEIRGETPYTMVDNKIIGTTSSVRIEKPGFKPFMTVISKTEEIDPGPVVCGLLFTPVWWLWGLKYRAVHTYELVPAEQ